MAPRTSRSRTRQTSVGIVLAVIVALLASLAGCSGSHSTPKQGSSSSSSSSATLVGGTYRSIGNGAAIQTTGSNGTDSTAKVQAALAPATAKPPFTGAVKAAGRVLHITPDGTQPKPVTIRFKLNAKATSASDVLIATSETGKPGSWTLVPATAISPDGMYAYVTTTHLSYWQALLSDANAIIKAVENELKQTASALTSDTTTVSPAASCTGEDQAKQAGYSSQSNGSALHWCLGYKNGKPYLRVISNRRYPLELSHPGLKATTVAHTSIDLDQLAKFASGNNTMLYPFEEADFALTTSGTGPTGILSNYSGSAQGLYQLQFGVETLIKILTRFGAGGGIIENGALTLTDADNIAAVMDKFLGITGCINALRGGVNPGSILNGCFSPSDLAEAFGWRGALLGAVMVAGQIVEFFHSELNAAVDSVNHHDQEAILVSYHKPDPLAPLEIHVWSRHMSTLKFKNGVATMFEGMGLGPWFSSNCGYWCSLNATLSVKANSDGTFTGTYTRVWYTDETTNTGNTQVPANPYPNSEVTKGQPAVGSTVHIARAPNDTLIVGGTIPSWCGPKTPLNAPNNCGP